MEAAVSYLLMLKQIYQFKGKDSKTEDYTLCLGNIPKDSKIEKETGLKGGINFFFCWF